MENAGTIGTNPFCMQNGTFLILHRHVVHSKLETGLFRGGIVGGFNRIPPCNYP